MGMVLRFLWRYKGNGGNLDSPNTPDHWARAWGERLRQVGGSDPPSSPVQQEGAPPPQHTASSNPTLAGGLLSQITPIVATPHPREGLQYKHLLYFTYTSDVTYTRIKKGLCQGRLDSNVPSLCENQLCGQMVLDRMKHPGSSTNTHPVEAILDCACSHLSCGGQEFDERRPRSAGVGSVGDREKETRPTSIRFCRRRIMLVICVVVVTKIPETLGASTLSRVDESAMAQKSESNVVNTMKHI